MRRLTTQYLLTCAVIGVAGAALLAPDGVGLPAFQWRRDRVAARPERAVAPVD